MRLDIKSTTKVVQLNGLPARIWEGVNEQGIPLHCFITRIAVADEMDQALFEASLEKCDAPSVAVAAYPARMVL